MCVRECGLFSPSTSSQTRNNISLTSHTKKRLAAAAPTTTPYTLFASLLCTVRVVLGAPHRSCATSATASSVRACLFSARRHPFLAHSPRQTAAAPPPPSTQSYTLTHTSRRHSEADSQSSSNSVATSSGRATHHHHHPTHKTYTQVLCVSDPTNSLCHSQNRTRSDSIPVDTGSDALVNCIRVVVPHPPHTPPSPLSNRPTLRSSAPRIHSCVCVFSCACVLRVCLCACLCGECLCVCVLQSKIVRRAVATSAAFRRRCRPTKTTL